MSKSPAQPQDKYVLRLPDGMRDRIKAMAEKNNRSMNAEIVATLEEAYGSDAVEVKRVFYPSMSFNAEEIISEIDKIKRDVSSIRLKGRRHCPSVSVHGKPLKARQKRRGSLTTKMPRGRGA